MFLSTRGFISCDKSNSKSMSVHSRTVSVYEINLFCQISTIAFPLTIVILDFIAFTSCEDRCNQFPALRSFLSNVLDTFLFSDRFI